MVTTEVKARSRQKINGAENCFVIVDIPTRDTNGARIKTELPDTAINVEIPWRIGSVLFVLLMVSLAKASVTWAPYLSGNWHTSSKTSWNT